MVTTSNVELAVPGMVPLSLRERDGVRGSQWEILLCGSDSGNNLPSP